MTSKTSIYYSTTCLNHNPGFGHPESPNRIRMIITELTKSKILENNKIILKAPDSWEIETLLSVHDYEYIKRIETTSSKGGGFLDDYDTIISSGSFDAALSAARGALSAVHAIMSKESRNSFAIVRPPGHHAGSNYAKGFCIFNNIAVAATYLIKNLNLERIAIIDIDAHHGNGTQEIFFHTSRVLYASLHQDPTQFPQTGFIDEVGESEGEGYTINIPLPSGTDDYTYNKAMNQVIMPIIKQYQPKFILVSAGYDGHYSDPIGNLSLSAFSYQRLFGQIEKLSSQICKGRLAVMLEGGYRLRLIGKLVTSTIAKIARLPYRIRDKRVFSRINTRNIGEKIIEKTLNTHSSFWDL